MTVKISSLQKGEKFKFAHAQQSNAVCVFHEVYKSELNTHYKYYVDDILCSIMENYDVLV